MSAALEEHHAKGVIRGASAKGGFEERPSALRQKQSTSPPQRVNQSVQLPIDYFGFFPNFDYFFIFE